MSKMKLIIDPGDSDHDSKDNFNNFYEKQIRISFFVEIWSNSDLTL